MIGAMNQSVEVFTTSFSPDGSGGQERTIASIGSYFAEVKHSTGGESEHAGRNADTLTVSFKMHNFNGFPVGSTSYINWNGQRHEVISREFEGSQQLFVVFKAVAQDQWESTSG